MLVMNIQVISGAGTGSTSLGAFDAALNDARVANYNLIRLSSVIPPHSTITKMPNGANSLPGDWGDRLYVVLAEQRCEKKGEQAWAGIGWVQDNETGKGLFVEHEGFSEEKVRGDISKSLSDLMKTRGVDFGEISTVVRGVTVEDSPVCSLVIAVYESSKWQSISEGVEI